MSSPLTTLYNVAVETEAQRINVINDKIVPTTFHPPESRTMPSLIAAEAKTPKGKTNEKALRLNVSSDTHQRSMMLATARMSQTRPRPQMTKATGTDTAYMATAIIRAVSAFAAFGLARAALSVSDIL